MISSSLCPGSYLPTTRADIIKLFPKAASAAAFPKAELIPSSLVSPLPETEERLEAGGLQHKKVVPRQPGFSGDRKRKPGLDKSRS